MPRADRTIDRPAQSVRKDPGAIAVTVMPRPAKVAATAAGLDNLDEEFEASYGLPIAQAGAQQMRQMTAILTGSAA